MVSAIFALIQILILSVHPDSCNYATFSVDILYPPLNVGTFSISTNRCQSLKATFTLAKNAIFDFTLPFDGSMMMKCVEYSDKYYQLQVHLYSDALCNDIINDGSDNTNEPIIIDMDHNKFTIYENVQFSLDEMDCNSAWEKTNDAPSCGISMEMANNCSWSGSQRYINISVPDSKCISLAPDFSGLLNMIPDQILPHEFVYDLEKQSLKFKCCSSDNSLLISNYSDTSCELQPDSQFRISQIYNGQCFVVGNDEDMIQNQHDRNDNENAHDTYVYIMRWTCNDFEDYCDDIPIIDEGMLPQECTQECIEMAMNQHSGVTMTPNGYNNDKSIKVIGVVVVVVVVVILFIGVIVGSVWYGRRKVLQKAVEQNFAGNINVNVKDEKLVEGDDKYEAFVSEAETENVESTQ
eukprot:108286_1